MILLHINDKIKRQQIIDLCHSLNHQVKLIDESDAKAAVGELAGLKKTKSEDIANNAKAGDFGSGRILDRNIKEGKLPDCIIFSDIPNLSMDIFLAEYKKRGIEPTHLKAVVTIYNMSWSLEKLIDELKREQIAIMMRGR